MAERNDLVTITIAKYEEKTKGFYLPLGKDRFSFNIWKYSIIIELWFLRGGLKYD